MKRLMAVPLFAPILTSGLCMAADLPSFSDTYVGYRYSSHFSDPGKQKDVAKNIAQLTHTSTYSLGQNFLNLDVFKSDSVDPKKDSSDGATEVYLTYRNQLQYGRVFGTPLAFGPVKDLALTGGFDWNTKNNAFESRKRMLVVGPTVKFALPSGFLDVSLFYAREWNHCGLAVCEQGDNKADILFDPFYQFNVNWGVPFSAGPVPLKFQGFYSLNGKKGDDYQNRATGVEQLMRTSLMVDVGRMTWGGKNVLWVGSGYEYWRNKFGNRTGAGINVNALSFNLEFHL